MHMLCKMEMNMLTIMNSIWLELGGVLKLG
jgi:hypothetical protein